MEMIASKQLTTTDLCKLTIPAKNFPSFPQPQKHHTIDFLVRDESGRVWPVGVETRKKGPYKKPILARGWGKLVLKNQLRVGDKVSFFKEVDQGKPQYMIKVEKITVDDGSVYDYGFDQVTGEADFKIEQKMMSGAMVDGAPVHVTVEAIGKATNSDEEIGGIKIFGDIMNDAPPIHGFDKPHNKTEEKSSIKLFGVTLVDAPVHGVAF